MCAKITIVLFSCVPVYKLMREMQGNLFLFMVDSSECSGIFLATSELNIMANSRTQ